MEKEHELNEEIETEQVSINGEDVEVAKNAEDRIFIKVRPGMTDEEKKVLTDILNDPKQNVSKLAAALHRKNHEANKLIEGLTKTREELEKAAPEPEKKVSPTIDPVWKFAGVTSAEAFEELLAENPKKYADAVRAHAKAEADASIEARLHEYKTMTEQQVQGALLEQSIKTAGFDPLDVKAFAKFNEMPFGEKAFALYKQVHSDKSNPVYEAQKKAQSQQITILEQPRGRFKANLSQKEIDELSDADLDAYYAYLRELPH